MAVAHAGRMPVVLLAGTLCDGRVFGPLVQALGDREVITLEMTGGRTISELAARALTAAPARFVLVGFSLGGIVALELATAAPERVAAVALISTNPRPVDRALHPQRRGAAAMARASGAGRYVEDVLWPSYVAPNRVEDSGLRGLVAEMADGAGVDVFADQIEAAISRVDYRPRLDRLTSPALIVAGEGDRVCEVQLQAEMAQSLPAATLAIVKDAGHFVLLEAPDAVASHLTSWLAEIETEPRSAPARLS